MGMNINWHGLSIAQTIEELKSNLNGLSTGEVARRRNQYGPNVLPKAKGEQTVFQVLLSQIINPLMMILIIAGIASFFLGELMDSLVISITAGLNIVVGFIQEYKANRALQKLQSMILYHSLVIRDGVKLLLASDELVTGDIVEIEAGDKIQADGRLVEADDLELNEAILTGESEFRKKITNSIPTIKAVADRENMVYSGTTVQNGHGRYIVTAIGKDTEIGKIASFVRSTPERKTPLQIQLGKISRTVGLVIICISVILLVVGIFINSNGYSLLVLIQTAIAVAIAAVPEGLVISLTVTLAIGMQNILRRNGLVRKLVAAETLGSVSVICVDKTGTITEGKMSAVYLIASDDEFNHDELQLINIHDKNHHPDAAMALRIGVICNNATENLGDSTETALISIGKNAGIEKEYFEKSWPRLAVLPFTSERKYMAVLHNIDAESHIYVKGAPEILLKKTTYFEEKGVVRKLTEAKKEWFHNKEKEMSQKGLRILYLGYRRLKSVKKDIRQTDVSDLIIVGLIGLSDPLRPNVKKTIDFARSAGIRVVMITGDHVKTAQAIGSQIGLRFHESHVFNGEQLENISDSELQERIEDLDIFARVDPKHKIRIVMALQANNEVVAMTGDGINDAPALKGADIGIALGSGSDVAKEISNLVLLDDKLETIVSSVEEGRTIYQNIKKIFLYLMGGSLCEVILIGTSIVLGLPLALLPAQILWINLVNEGFMVIMLSFDKGDKENMKDGPRPKNTPFLDRSMIIMLALISVLTNFSLLGIYIFFYVRISDIDLVRTLVFAGLCMAGLFTIFSARHLRTVFWRNSPFGNKYLNAGILFSLFLLISAIYWHPLQTMLHTIPLLWYHWLILLVVAFSNVLLIEGGKYLFIIKKSKLM